MTVTSSPPGDLRTSQTDPLLLVGNGKAQHQCEALHSYCLTLSWLTTGWSELLFRSYSSVKPHSSGSGLVQRTSIVCSQQHSIPLIHPHSKDIQQNLKLGLSILQ